jgi:hypothetical protein
MFHKNLQNQISQKSDQWEPSLHMRTDWRTNRTKLIGAFRNLCHSAWKSIQALRAHKSNWNVVANRTTLNWILQLLRYNTSFLLFEQPCWLIHGRGCPKSQQVSKHKQSLTILVHSYRYNVCLKYFSAWSLFSDLWSNYSHDTSENTCKISLIALRI